MRLEEAERLPKVTQHLGRAGQHTHKPSFRASPQGRRREGKYCPLFRESETGAQGN